MQPFAAAELGGDRPGERVELTAKGFDLLGFLAAAARQVFSREQLLRPVRNS